MGLRRIITLHGHDRLGHKYYPPPVARDNNTTNPCTPGFPPVDIQTYIHTDVYRRSPQLNHAKKSLGRWIMPGRSVRKSTKQLRLQYGASHKKQNKNHHERNGGSTGDRGPSEQGVMAATNQQVPPAATDPPPDPQNDGGDNDPIVPDSPNSRHPSARSRSTTSASTKENDDRLKRVEDLLLEMKDKAPSRQARPSPAPSHRARTAEPRGRPTYSPVSRRSRRSPTPRTSRRYTRSRSRGSRPRTRSTSRRRSHTRSPRQSYRRSSRTRSRTHSRHSRRRSRSRSRARPSPKRHRARTPLREELSAQRELDIAMEAQYPDMGSFKGKRLHVRGATLEPYRNLPPDIRSRAAARRSRRDLTFPEHVCGLLNMALQAMDPKSEPYTVVKHVAQVAQDATTLLWSGVRSWSQACLTHIQDGEATWKNDTAFERERTHLSWFRGKSDSEIKVPCMEHNLDTCVERKTHRGEGMTHVHTCPVCFYTMGDDKTTHVFEKCRRKNTFRHQHEDNRNDYRRRNNNNNRRDAKPDQAKSKN